MDENDKLAEIENYLKTLSPGCIVENTWDSETRRYIFKINAPAGEIKHVIGITAEFISDNTPGDIVFSLKLYNLKGYLEIFRNKEVLVTNDGVNPDGKRPLIIK